jgi:hypothetical protein
MGGGAVLSRPTGYPNRANKLVRHQQEEDMPHQWSSEEEQMRLLTPITGW